MRALNRSLFGELFQRKSQHIPFIVSKVLNCQCLLAMLGRRSGRVMEPSSAAGPAHAGRTGSGPVRVVNTVTLQSFTSRQRTHRGPSSKWRRRLGTSGCRAPQHSCAPRYSPRVRSDPSARGGCTATRRANRMAMAMARLTVTAAMQTLCVH